MWLRDPFKLVAEVYVHFLLVMQASAKVDSQDIKALIRRLAIDT